MKYLINYAGGGAFEEARRQNSITGLKFGFDAVIEYSPDTIDKSFYNINRNILDHKRGAGYWLWKPHIIMETLRRVNEGDIIFYSDAGASFFRDMQPMFDLIEEKNLVGFNMSGGHKEKQYTRKNVIRQFFPNVDDVADTNQDMASFIGVKKTSAHDILLPLTDWLTNCQKPELIMDFERDSDEFQEFIDHRHDQSLWSLISKKHGVHKAPDPTQWGINSGESTAEDFFIHHHRNRS